MAEFRSSYCLENFFTTPGFYLDQKTTTRGLACAAGFAILLPRPDLTLQLKADPESMQMQFPDFSASPMANDPTSIDSRRLSQVFNTALVHTRLDGAADPKELFRLMEQPAFHAVLSCVQAFAQRQGISEIDSAKEIIRTFRRIDEIWTAYLIQEGTEKLKNP